jgi:predicted nucleic acid-binding protein
MPVVSNTSPLLNQAIIVQLDLLPRQFDQVLVLPAVIEELKIDSSLPGTDRIRQGMESGWLTVCDIDAQQVVRALERELDRGESEAIA